LQRVVVGLVFDVAADAVVEGHDDEAEKRGQREQQGNGGSIRQSCVEVLRFYSPVEDEVCQV